MCGITGFIGDDNGVPLVIKALKQLEYRGYDSTGISAYAEDKLTVKKCPGKVSELESLLPPDLKANSVIGHTRWATHGVVNEANAHPHVSSNGNFAIVHNGIIENYREIREKLEAKGYSFYSQTDSEVIAALLEYYEEKGFEEAFFTMLTKLEGTYGILAMSRTEPGYLMTARNGSPLCIGFTSHSSLVASDQIVFAGISPSVLNLSDGEVARILPAGKYSIYNLKREIIKKTVESLQQNPEDISLKHHKHYMHKEIFEQPDILRQSMAGRIHSDEATVKLSCLDFYREEVPQLEHIGIVSCGTSYHAGLIGAYLIEELTRIKCSVELASEFHYRNPVLPPHSLYIAISQSGETADTLLAVKELQARGGKTLGLCNRVGSSLTQLVTQGIYLHAGPEVSVASTKAFSAQVSVMSQIAIGIGRRRDLGFAAVQTLLHDLERVPEKIELVLQKEDKIAALAQKYRNAKSFILLGRGINYPVTLEAALKITEISYIMAQGIAGGEMKHGTLALIDPEQVSIHIIADDHLLSKNLNNLAEVKARGGQTITLCSENLLGNPQIVENSNDIISFPNTNPLFSPLLSVIPMQLFAYQFALQLGRPIDQPRNLAKSVTVE